MVSSYCSVVTSDAGVKRARIPVLRASIVGVADGLVAIRGLLRVDAPGQADLQPNASYDARLAGEESEPESSPQRITVLPRIAAGLRNGPAWIRTRDQRIMSPLL